jgi:hypothetical protein
MKEFSHSLQSASGQIVGNFSEWPHGPQDLGRVLGLVSPKPFFLDFAGVSRRKFWRKFVDRPPRCRMSYSVTPTKPSKEAGIAQPLLNFLPETESEADSSQTPFVALAGQHGGPLANGIQTTTAAPSIRPKGWGASGDFGAYMASKIQRLREAAANVENSDDLFRSVCVWVTGLTNPPSMELRQLIRVCLCCHSVSTRLGGTFHHTK